MGSESADLVSASVTVSYLLGLRRLTVYYWRTWYKAVCGGKGESEGHVTVVTAVTLDAGNTPTLSLTHTNTHTQTHTHTHTIHTRARAHTHTNTERGMKYHTCSHAGSGATCEYAPAVNTSEMLSAEERDVLRGRSHCSTSPRCCQRRRTQSILKAPPPSAPQRVRKCADTTRMWWR